MSKEKENQYVKRPQRDYSYAFKLAVVREVESGENGFKSCTVQIRYPRRYTKAALIHHSDRGLQYCCDDYQDTLVKHEIRTSMTEKYDPLPKCYSGKD